MALMMRFSIMQMRLLQRKECEYFPCHKVDSGDELLQVNIGKLREEIWERMAQIASWEKMDKEMYCEHCIGQKDGCEFCENYTRQGAVTGKKVEITPYRV